jgi:60 kDa SS-A/Ro ribonucleoprotein
MFSDLFLHPSYEVRMASINRATKRTPVFTHEGAKAVHHTPEEQLRRVVLTAMLFEGTFYVDGRTHAEIIVECVAKVKPAVAAQIAIEAREQQHLRHVPLWIARAMAGLPSHRPYVADLLERIIQRPDEIGEFIAQYWLTGRQPLANCVKRGLARAFTKFNAYQLTKWRGASKSITLRDAMFLVHPKPRDAEQAEVFRKLAAGELTSADTWETNLSAGKDKRETFTRLIGEKKLGGLATLRNLRNMSESGMTREEIKGALETANFRRVLPFRFVAAAKAVPQMEDIVEPAMLRAASERAKLPGRTVLLVDVSGSMYGWGAGLSAKSDLARCDAAAALAILVRECCEETAIFTFSGNLMAVPPRRGFALRDALNASQAHGSTMLAAAVSGINRHFAATRYTRLIIITDEQSHDGIAAPLHDAVGYCINVAPYRNGVADRNGYHAIDGWSEAVLDYIYALEAVQLDAGRASDDTEGETDDGLTEGVATLDIATGT